MAADSNKRFFLDGFLSDPHRADDLVRRAQRRHTFSIRSLPGFGLVKHTGYLGDSLAPRLVECRAGREAFD